jgi:hypothetical protein
VPTAEGLVVAAVAVDGDANVHIARVELLGGLRQGGLDRAKDHVAFDVLLARDRIHQHQHFAIHATTLLVQSDTVVSGLGLRPLKSTIGASRASRSSSNAKPSACRGAGARFLLIF